MYTLIVFLRFPILLPVFSITLSSPSPPAGISLSRVQDGRDSSRAGSTRRPGPAHPACHDAALLPEEPHSPLDGHVQHVVNRPAAAFDLQDVFSKSAALAALAGHVEVGQELHVHPDGAGPLAVLAVESDRARVRLPLLLIRLLADVL